MAQPPTTTPTDIFLREVDENLRRDRARDFARKYGNWLIGAVLLFLLASGVWIYWQNVREKKAGAQVEELGEIYLKIGNNQPGKSAARLEQLATDGSSKAVRASAMFTAAALAIQTGNQPAAIAKYRAIAATDGLPAPYRDAAMIRQTALEFDQLKSEEVIARLAPLAKPGNPWFGSAGEMTALALIKQGKGPQAGQLFAAIAKDKTVPESLRARAVQIASTLGVDASGALAQ
ncbi:MAG: tetratricopeptide repeat protein [Sphingomicrobium sp.]